MERGTIQKARRQLRVLVRAAETLTHAETEEYWRLIMRVLAWAEEAHEVLSDLDGYQGGDEQLELELARQVDLLLDVD